MIRRNNILSLFKMSMLFKNRQAKTSERIIMIWPEEENWDSFHRRRALPGGDVSLSSHCQSHCFTLPGCLWLHQSTTCCTGSVLQSKSHQGQVCLLHYLPHQPLGHLETRFAMLLRLSLQTTDMSAKQCTAKLSGHSLAAHCEDPQETLLPVMTPHG